MNMQFKEWDCLLVGGYYGNNRKAIELIDADDGEPIATATVNLPDYPLPDSMVFIKDYSENEGMVDALVNAQIIEPGAYREVETGHVIVGMYQLTKDGLSLWSQ